MKIYVVTTGSYSDYSIHSIFLNKDKAMECEALLENANDIEEYETSDDATFNYITEFRIYVENSDFGLRCQVVVGKTDPITTDPYKDRTDVYVDYKKKVSLVLRRYVSDKNMNISKIEFYEDKYKKAAQDIWYVVQQKLFDGYTIDQINQLIKS